jgi:DNA-binding XRE family transcriptional regulator
MAGGRPTLYKEEFCDLLISHMEKGYSYESFAGLLGVSKQTIYDWEKANQEFLDSKKIGTEKSRLFWEKVGIENIVNIDTMEKDESGSFTAVKKSLNSAVYIFNMKNRFKDEWKDKHENEFSGSIGTVIMPTPLDEDLQEND